MMVGATWLVALLCMVEEKVSYVYALWGVPVEVLVADVK